MERTVRSEANKEQELLELRSQEIKRREKAPEVRGSASMIFQ